MTKSFPAPLLIATALALPAQADPARITQIDAVVFDTGWRFSVTIEHGDTGWDDYADGWRVELADGTVLATRTLLHPHVDEQPFTRSQTGIEIPDGIGTVMIRASTNVEGWDTESTAYRLPGAP